MGMVGFWFLEVTSLLYIVMTLNFFISGHMLPLDLLPRAVAHSLITCRSNTWPIFPAVVFLGKVKGTDLVFPLAGWAGVGCFLHRAGARSLSSGAAQVQRVWRLTW